MHPLTRFLRFFFHHLYHGLAWTYDLVSGLVSFGRWNDWIREAAPLIRGRRVLELGHGPGHLQLQLAQIAGLTPVGLDESPQMGRIARARLRRGKTNAVRLARGMAQALPFPARAFDCAVSTFPSEYIFDGDSLSEIRRILKPGAQLIVLPVAWPRNRFLAWLFRITRQSPADALETAREKLKIPFIQAGFKTEIRVHEVQSGTLLIVLAAAPGAPLDE
jgi:ubiquinone/menaquinone biosynthesis C-methylase UbiE